MKRYIQVSLFETAISISFKKHSIYLAFIFLIAGLAGSNHLYAQSPGNGQLDSLLTQVHPTIYFHNGIMDTEGGGNYTVLRCDIESVPYLFESEEIYNNVQLVILKVQEGESLPLINLANLITFNELLYFYIEFEFDACGDNSSQCLNNLVQNAISNSGTNVSLIYTIAIPN